MKPVYTLDDLESRERLDEGASLPAKLAVIGLPIAHSASPQMHQAALDAREIDARYIRIEVEPGRVAEAFERMRALGFIGCNVTVPHKIEAMAACSQVDPDARRIGAVNTIRFDANGISGFNTDGPGFMRAVEEDFGIRLAASRVMIVGAGGGAGQAIATQCVLTDVPELVLVNRSVDKIEALALRLSEFCQTTAIRVLALDDARVIAQARACGLIVNTSSVGLKPGDPCVLPIDALAPHQAVYDTIYKPAVTPLLEAANAAGCRTSNGLSMLIHQGALAFAHWFPGQNALPEMRAAMGHLPSV